MSSRGEGVESPEDAPDDHDTVMRPAVPPAADGSSQPSPTSQPQQPSPPPPPEFIDRAPFGRPAVPDQGPIQSFDRRPRLDSSAQPPDLRTTPSPQPAPGPRPVTDPGPSSPSAIPPGIDATRSPRRRGLLLPAVAFGCAMLLLLGIGGGLTALWLASPWDRPSATATGDPAGTDPEGADPHGTGPADGSPRAEPGHWQPLTDGQTPVGDAEELQQVLTDNPLLQAQLSGPGGCALPDVAGGAVPAAELTAFLQDGADCLATSWADALRPAGIEFEAPEVVTYTTDSLPADAACEPARFTDAAPVVCHGDNTLYWPSAWDPGFSHTSAEEAPQLYMWHLSYSYTLFVLSAASLDGYYGALQVALADDQEGADGAQRRWALQISCLSSVAVFQLPTGPQPDGRVEDFVTSTEAQASPATSGEPSPQSRAAWVRAGRDSGGDLGACGTWSAPAGEVA
ncbi:MAG TPA: hypothetical protein VF289_05655 [Brachybacterium sp.]